MFTFACRGGHVVEVMEGMVGGREEREGDRAGIGTVDVFIVIFAVTICQIEGQNRNDEDVAAQRANVPYAGGGTRGQV